MSEDFLGPVIAKLDRLLAEEATLLDGVHKEVKSLSEKLEIIQRLLRDAEAKPLIAVHQEVKSLKDELETIQATLKDADPKSDKAWENQIRSQADRVEEAVEGYRRELSEIQDDQSGFAGPLTRTGQLILSLKPRREIACEIQSIQQSLSRIKGVGSGHGLSGVPTDDEAREDPRLGSLRGVEEMMRDLVEGLSTRSVVSLVGDGGIGKANCTARKAFDDLPYVLRPCLLYFGIFPEDFSIVDERLYRLWIAEGLVEAKGDKTLEEVAEEYLSELVKRNLVSYERRSVGEGKWYRVHDSLRDFVQSRADELYLSRIWEETKSSGFEGKGRRLTISGGRKNSSKNSEGFGVRSLFLSGVDDGPLAKDLMASLLEKFQLLEVFDVENVVVDSLPKELGNLFWLKYLSLRHTKVTELPNSIGKLRNLQSLDIRDSLIRELPNEVNKLKKLRHILAYSCNQYGSTFTYVLGVRLQEGFGNLEDLQTLTLAEANLGGVALMKELEKLRKLRWLGVSKCTRETGPALCAAIDKMSHLERLYLAAMNENEALDLQHVSSPPRFLREILLAGRLEMFPPWITQLSNLTGLCLMASRLLDDPMRSLKYLPNLESLDLSSQAYEGEQLHFEGGGFSKLGKLSMYTLDKLKAVRIDGGALPVLEELDIGYCPLLREMPSVQHLRSLKTASANGIRLK